MNLIKIDIAKTKRFGSSTRLFLNIPKVYSEDNKLEFGDEIEFFRTEINGRDALILLPQNSNGKSNGSASLKSQESEAVSE